MIIYIPPAAGNDSENADNSSVKPQVSLLEQVGHNN